MGRRRRDDESSSRSRKNNNNNNNDVVISNNRKDNGSQRILLLVLPFTIVSGIGIFGLVSTVLLITTNVNNSYFNIYSFIVQHLPDGKNVDGINGESNGKDNNPTPTINKCN